MKSIYIKDLEKNLIITGETFLIVESSKSEDKNGNDYYKLVLADKTGKCEAKVWADKLANISRDALKSGFLVMVSGKVDEYKGKFQITVYDAKSVDETKLDDYIESSEYDSDEMMVDLLKEIDDIKREDLKKVLKEIIEDTELNRKLKFWPAARSVHHDFRSGMIQHILEMLTFSKGLIKFYPNIDYDVLRAGIILHDIGKLEELGSSPVGADYSKKGSLLGHITIGVMLFGEHAKGKLDEDVFLHICHLILSHHGTHEFGSPVLPATTEAVMLYYLDNLSAKSRTADSAIRKIKNTEEEFTDFNRWMGGVKLWKGTSPSTKDDVIIQDQHETESTGFDLSDEPDPSLF